MRWPWNSPKTPPVEIPDDSADSAAAAAAVERARRAVEKAETNGDTMHHIAKAIYRERQRNNFSVEIYRSMRRKES